MKNSKTLLILFLTILGIQCQAQTPIINLMDIEPNTPDYYRKDINNVLNQFEGTYVLNDGTNYLKIVFQKKIMQHIGDTYQDILIGEYQYKENGVEKINTLHKLNEVLPNAYHYSINGNSFLTYHPSSFSDYTTDDFRLDIGMSVPGGQFANLDVRKCVVNGQEAIQIFKRTKYYVKRGEPVPPIIVPNGFFYLIKE
jgi:hypothetical protein